MTANLQINNNGIPSAYWVPLTTDINNAWANLMGHFDYTTGTITMNVYWQPNATYAESSAPDGFVYTGTASNGYVVEENSSLQTALTGSSSGPSSITLNVAGPWAQNTYPTASNPNPEWLHDGVRANEHELIHMMGNDYSLYNTSNDTIPGWVETQYDQNVNITNGQPYFIGANAEAMYGGPVPLDPSIDHPYFGPETPSNVNDVGSVMSYDQTQGWSSTTMTDFDIAMMQDDNVPILTSNEVAEHTVIDNLVALGHDYLDGSQVQSLANTLLHADSNSVVTLDEQLISAYGPSGQTDAQFINFISNNATGTNADSTTMAADQATINGEGETLGRATILQTAATSDTLHKNLANYENVWYANTSEETTTRMAELAFGNAPTPQQYETGLNAMINGASLQQIGMQFLAAPQAASLASENNTDFVDTMFNKSGYEYDTNMANWDIWQLDTGQVTRGNILADFSESGPYVSHMANLAYNAVGGSPNGETALIGYVSTLPANHIVTS